MRLAAYAGASTALAAGVVIYAFNQRANFYSACVYLSQSNLCLMIITNLSLFILASIMFGLQRMFYGPLRPIEIEQLYEKAWFAVTETCLAMTIFREEVGAWFLVMFVALLAGKVWGWIGEGRVEVLEQQPPPNPRLVHIRLSLSLALSLIYDMWMLGYTINAVIQQARPNMMVMFLFEFAVLTTSSSSTAVRYALSLIEARIVKKQTQERLEWRRREVREEREEILRQRAAAVAPGGTETGQTTPDLRELPSEDDVDEMDIEVPGWEAKGQWVLSLDLLTDFVKLAIYTTFFFILLTFYGLPIHIMRDLFLTARSFVKRLTAFLRYRKATHDMNERYPDASIEEIQREDTCIICREEMRPWSVTNPAEPDAAPVNGEGQPPAARPRISPLVNERSRPKKLPCGHVLHLGCLKSWLERQQVCPTCRRPVVDNARPNGQAQQGQGAQAGGRAHPANGPAQQGNGNMRMLQIGPLRFAFGQANNMQDFAQRLPGAQAAGQQNAAPGNGPRVYGLEFGFPRLQPQQQVPAAAATEPLDSIPSQLRRIENRIVGDILQYQLNQSEVQVIMHLQQQLTRIRAMRQGHPIDQQTGSAPHSAQPLPTPSPMANPRNLNAASRIQHHGAPLGSPAIPSGSLDLPAGVTIPEGWTLLPLHRMDHSPMISPAVNGVLSHLAAHAPTFNVNAPVSDSRAQTSQLVPNAALTPRNDRTQDASQTGTMPTFSFMEQSESVPETSSSGHQAAAGTPISPSGWAASQPLAAPALIPNNSGLEPKPTPAESLPKSSALSASPSISLAENSSSPIQATNGTAVHPDNSQETSSGTNSKGKARAVTVEDENEDS